MKITHMPRRAGKTTKAIEECKRTGATLAVCNQQMKRMVIEMGLPEAQVMTHHELIHNDFHRFRGRSDSPWYKGLIIDDADYLLHQLADGIPIRRVTMSKAFTKAYCLKRGYPLDFIGKC